MLKRFLLIVSLSLCFILGAFAQNTYSISGVISDKKETLPGAAVYVSGYKIATVTDNEGRFTLPKLLPGNYDILVQMIGYLPYSQNVVISDQSVVLNAVLEENTTMLKEVVIKPDPNRAYYINQFKTYFLGITPNSYQCKILNTEVINVTDNKAERLLAFSADDFLIIENNALGYRIKYLLKTFEYDYKTKIFYYAGNPSFEEMKGSRAKENKWKKNREIAYYGSAQHFFEALYKGTATEEGFVINKRRSIKNKDRKPDSMINANIKRLANGPNGPINLITYDGNDSLSYWLKEKRKPEVLDVLDRAAVLTDTLVKTFDENIKSINFTDQLFIIYKNEKESEKYDYTGFKQNRPIDIGNSQVSVIIMLDPPFKFYADGGVFNPRSVLYSGYWAYEKVGDLLPLDYIPPPKNLK